MDHCVVYDASVLYAVITGTSATLLSILLWSVFRRSPIGKALFALLLVLSLFTVQNGLVLLFSCEVFAVRLLKSGINTGFLVVVLLLIGVYHAFDDDAIGGDSP